MEKPTDSQQLYAALRQNDSPAQSAAYQQLWDQLYRVAYAMLHTRRDCAELAADCTQQSLIKIHRSLDQCQSPAAFREWANRILRRTVIDELRRAHNSRQVALPEDNDHLPWLADLQTAEAPADLRAFLLAVIEKGPLSERSRRVVLGRYLAEQTDEFLAEVETNIAGQTVLPSHVQVTRSKNLATLRRDQELLLRLRELLED